jgi:cell division protein FtsW
MKFILTFSGIGLLVLVFFIGGALLIKKEGRIQTWKSRIEHFVRGDTDELYQVEQAKIAVATGGFFGKKPGRSTQRNFLPHPYSDFIFAIIIEEYGFFFGALPLVLAYMILLYRGGVLVQKANRTFPAFLAVGLTLLIVYGRGGELVPGNGSDIAFCKHGGFFPVVHIGGSGHHTECQQGH